MIGRFLTGLSAGCYCYVLPIYVGEISSDEIRGTMLSIFQVMLNLGVLFTFTVGHFSSLLVLNIVCGAIPLLYTVGMLLLPESPRLLISKNREIDAKNSLKIIRGKSYNFDEEIENLKKQNFELKSQNKTFSEVFKTKSTKKAFIIIMLQFFFFQMTGINVVLFYSTSIFIEAGIGLEPGIASIIVASMQVLSTFLAVAFADKFGRKTLLSLSNGFMCISLIGIGTFFVLKDSDFDVSWLGWLPLASLCVFVVAFSGGIGPVSYILLGELFLQDAKAYVAPFGQTMSFLLTFVIGLTFLMLTSAIGIGQTFFMFSGFCFLALIFTIIAIPETKGKTLTEIQDLLG
jgi:sugar porter (SP) family MFS transporter